MTEKINESRNNELVHYVGPKIFAYLSYETTQEKLLSQSQHYFLDISIDELKYKYHHTFSLEQILVYKLEDYYNEYIANEKSVIEVLQAIDVNRQTRANLIEKLSNISPKKKIDIRFDPTIIKYTEAMLSLKKEYSSKIKQKRKLLKIILALWTDIKHVRQTLDTVQLPHRLEVKKVFLSDEDYSKKWNDIYLIEYSDMLIKLEHEYVIKYLEFKNYKNQSDSVDKIKPKLKIKPDDIQRTVEKEIHLLISPEDVAVELRLDCIKDSKRKSEYDEIGKHLYLKVYVDDIFVCECKRLVVNDYSNIEYQDSITLQILPNNASLKFILCDSDNEISSVIVDINDGRENSKRGIVTEKKFVDQSKIVTPTERSIGSGFRILNIASITNNICTGQVMKSHITNFLDQIDVDRFKLLSLRNSGSFGNIKNKVVPLFQSQITTEQFNVLQKSKKNILDDEYLESRDANPNIDPINMQRHMGKRYIEQLHTKLEMDLRERLMRKTHKDVVIDYESVNLRSFLCMKPNISLGTQSSLSKIQYMEEALATEQEIHIHILRAFNLYDRSLDDTEGPSSIAGYKLRTVRPFVKISYHGESVQTPVAIGCNPTWNYTNTIKTNLKPLTSIHIDVFDEHKMRIGEESDELHQSYRCYNKWLGSLEVPIKTVLSYGSVRGTLKMTTPPIILGYQNENEDNKMEISEINRLMRKDVAFLSLCITTSLSKLGEMHFYNLPTDPDDHIIRHLNNFVTEYQNNFPNRNISLTLIDSAGKNKCVTEFIQPLPLPEIILSYPKRSGSASRSSKSSSSKRSDSNIEETFKLSRPVDGGILEKMDIARRYVSLIPTYEIVQTCCVTLSGIELLKVLIGSPLDHALLLASYFIGMGIKCWIVIGYGLPRGQSSYVLVKYHGDVVVTIDYPESKGFFNKSEFEYYIFDAVNGERYNVREGCPLKTASYVFNNENIWANIQSYQECGNLSFDFTKSMDWQVVFNKYVFVLSKPAVKFVYNAPGDIELLRSNLENKIKVKIQKWRWNVKTIWNRYLSNLLRESLPHWEYWSFNKHAEKPVFGQRLKQMLLTYRIFGFPMNVPYTDTKSVVKKVKSTMFYLSGDPNAEFGLAVDVFAYPNNVLSVWIFLANMSRL
ncbi:unnamed protein product [Leptosia nina]|uniref:C2 domain-containing protein n=1 Tax=Leptosia nina TaxID=320188 RepID=A0AAV1J882_9NEOP